MAGKVGFIGLGAMGGPMALNLAKAGHKLVVHDIDQSKTAAVRAQGAELAGNAEAVAAAVERTILIVETTDQAKEVIAGERGIIKGAKPGHIVVCMSTIDPFAARELAEQLKAKGIAMVDAPVSGGTGRAQSGELSVIVGGDKEIVAKCEDLFKAMGNRTFHVGPLGNGLAMKLVNNMLVQVNTVAVAEALVLGVKAGSIRSRSTTSCASRPAPARPGSCACRASSRATTSPAARSTSPTRTRSSRPPLPSGWACPCCSRTSRSRSTRWPARKASTSRTARRW
jgi:3-hydroxyisobutyrate dehydrogenase-like beta-hydroxyacid dehydrogenase